MSRPTNLKSGQPFVVEDSITVDYQSILTAANALRTTLDRNVLWHRYMELHTAVERLMLDLGVC